MTADRGGDPGSSRDREGLRLTEEQAERWQPIVQQRAESYVKQKANALKWADTGVFYDAGIDAVARAIAAYKGDPKGLDAYIGRAVSNAFNTTASRLGKNQTASLDESVGEDGSQTRGDTIQSKELSPEDAAIMKNAKVRLAEWMKNLSETDRKILALTKAGKKLREVGEAVGKSHEFVRQRIAELKAEARKAMEVSGEFQGMVGEQKKAQ